MSTTDATEARRQRGMQIAAVCRIERKNGQFIVPSQGGSGGRYWVKVAPDTPHCTCEDFETRGKPCKHIYAVEFFLQRDTGQRAIGADIEGTLKALIKPTRAVAERPTYKQVWPAYNAAQMHEKAKFQVLLHDLCRVLPPPPKTGGRRTLPLSDTVFSAVFKVYSTVSGRRFHTDLREAEAKGYIGKAPHYNSVFRCLEDAALTPILHRMITESSLPLKAVEVDFTVDSSGFTASRFVRWYDMKYGTVKQAKDWVKAHVMSGVKTNVITAVEIAGRHAGDSPMFKPLVQATAKNFGIREVSADGIYASNENFGVVDECGGTAFIPFKSNATGSVGGLYEKMFHFYSLNRDEYLKHYHKRSNAESTFSSVKAKFGDSLRSKTDTAMVNEALCKLLCHNICCLTQSMYELGIDPVFWGNTVESAIDPEPETTPDEPQMWDWL